MLPTFVWGRAYPQLLFLAAAIGIATTIAAGRREGIALGRLFLTEALLVGAAFAGARTFWLWENGLLRSAESAALPLAGFRYPGGIVAVVLTLPLACRLTGIAPARFGDVVAAPTALAMAVVRIGCFLQGCCFGRPTNLPWGVSFPVDSPAWNHHVAAGLIASTASRSLAVHPLQIYFALWSLGVAVVLFSLRGHFRFSGQAALLFLTLHETGKGLLELLRDPPQSDLLLTSLVLAVAGFTGLVLLSRRQTAHGSGRARLQPSQ